MVRPLKGTMYVSETREQLRSRRITLPDGRYPIFYTFEPVDSLTLSQSAVAETEPEGIRPAEEN